MVFKVYKILFSENVVPGNEVWSLVEWRKELQGNNRPVETHQHQHLEAQQLIIRIITNYEDELKWNVFLILNRMIF